MFKVAIADDEALARIGIKSIIPFQELGLEFAWEASGGREALNLIENDCPDILLLDIKMPDMDGIEVLNKISGIERSPKVIVLSCHEDYTYVRQAMKLGAVDYILKLSLKPEELKNILHRAINLLLEQSTESGQKKLKGRTELIRNLLNGKIWGEKLLEEHKELNRLNKTLDSAPCYVLRIRPKISEKKRSDMFFLVIEQILSEYKNVCCIPMENGEFAAFLWAVNEKKIIRDICQRIESFLRLYLTAEVQIVVSSPFQGAKQAHPAFLQAEQIFENFFYCPVTPILYEENCAPLSGKITPAVSDLISGFRSAISYENQKEMEDFCNQIFYQIEAESSLSSSAVKEIFMEMIHLCLDRLREQSRDFIEEYGDLPYSMVMGSQNLCELKENISQFLDLYFGFLQGMSRPKVREDILKIRRYIDENYRKDLSLGGTAAQINMSENYFSTLFKKEVGMSFVDYLNTVRIERAKELILDGHKVQEVAYMVGYNSISYFSRLFKKVAGINPSSLTK